MTIRIFTPLQARLPLLLFLASLSGGAAGADNQDDPDVPLTSAVQESIRLNQDVARFNQQIAELESATGPYHANLYVPLRGLTETLVQALDYDAAESVLSRRLMLTRALEGPNSADQLPILQEAIDNDIRRQDWAQVTRRFEYILWLRSQDQSAEPEVLLKAREDLAQWHLAAVSFDQPGSRVGHFLAAQKLQREIMELARALYDGDNVKLIPWLYSDAAFHYQEWAFLSADDELGFDMRREVLGADHVERRLEEVNEFIAFGGLGRPPPDPVERELELTLREGLERVREIGTLLAESGDLEGEAMALVYQADFQLLLDRGVAPRTYRQAMDKLAAAGLSEDRINQFFSRTLPLPEPELHLRLEAALAAQEQRGFLAADEATGVTDLGTYQAWNESLPTVARPSLPAAADAARAAVSVHEVEVAFDLNLTGKTRNPDIVSSTTDKTSVRREVLDAIRDMQFRPRFEGRRWRRMDNLHMTYTLPVRE